MVQKRRRSGKRRHAVWVDGRRFGNWSVGEKSPIALKMAGRGFERYGLITSVENFRLPADRGNRFHSHRRSYCQVRVLRLGLLQDGDVRVGVFPEQGDAMIVPCLRPYPLKVGLEIFEEPKIIVRSLLEKRQVATIRR